MFRPLPLPFDLSSRSLSPSISSSFLFLEAFKALSSKCPERRRAFSSLLLFNSEDGDGEEDGEEGNFDCDSIGSTESSELLLP